MSGFAPAHHVLTFGAAGARGQTAAITALLERHGAYIEEFTVFDDVLSGRFYLRTAFRLVEPGATALATMGREYEALRAHYADAEGAIHDQQRPARLAHPANNTVAARQINYQRREAHAILHSHH